MKFIIYLMYITMTRLHSFLYKIFNVGKLGKTRQCFPG